MEQSQSWEPKSFSTIQEIPLHFMEHEDSLPHLQKHKTCSYSEPDQSSQGRYWNLCRYILKFIQCDTEDYKPDPKVNKTWPWSL